MARDNDAMLVEACLRGDRHAFDELVDRYEGPLFSAAYRITGSIEDAMDATQNAFVNAYEKLHTFDPTYRFFSWIYRITLNESINWLGKANRLQPLKQEAVDEGRSLEQEVDSANLSKGVQAALMAINSDYRTVIVLKHILGCSYSEIGEILEIPDKTVKSRLYSARQQLKDILTQTGVH